MSIRLPLTSFAYQQKEPYAARQIDQQRHGIVWVTQKVEDGEESAADLGLEPAALDGVGVEDGVRRWVVVPCGATDEGGGQAPGDADEGEAEDVVEGTGLVDELDRVGHGACVARLVWVQSMPLLERADGDFQPHMRE